MASPYSKCNKCKGNIWPPSSMDHMHLDTTTTNWPLKRKMRVGFTGRRGGAASRTNTGKGKDSNQGYGVRRKAYGPW